MVLGHMELALLIGGCAIACLLLVGGLAYCYARRARARKAMLARARWRNGHERRRGRSRTQFQTIIYISKILHEYYKGQEELGVQVAEKQAAAHQRLIERLAEKKSHAEAVRDAIAVRSAIQDSGATTSLDIGAALEHDVEWRKYSSSEATVDHPSISSPEGAEAIGEDLDKNIDQLLKDKSFRKAIDMKIPKQERRVSSLKILRTLSIDAKAAKPKDPAGDGGGIKQKMDHET
jgi:hypothetical protein